MLRRKSVRPTMCSVSRNFYQHTPTKPSRPGIRESLSPKPACATNRQRNLHGCFQDTNPYQESTSFDSTTVFVAFSMVCLLKYTFLCKSLPMHLLPSWHRTVPRVWYTHTTLFMCYSTFKRDPAKPRNETCHTFNCICGQTRAGMTKPELT